MNIRHHIRRWLHRSPPNGPSADEVHCEENEKHRERQHEREQREQELNRRIEALTRMSKVVRDNEANQP
jgi:transcriptional regulator of NAD metabolism